jgi:outer membrane receptor protein involved in Fe transport
VPEQTLKAGLDWSFAERWSVGVDGLWVSSRPYQGDESNDLAPVAGFAVANAELRYRLGERLAVGLRLANVFDQEYATFGVLGDPTEVFPDFDDKRFVTPGQPRTLELWLGARF